MANEKQGMVTVRLKEADAEANEKQGMVDVRIKEADAQANEKQGMVAVRIKEADALAKEQHGMADVRVKEADAKAVEMQGMASANVLKARLLAESEGLSEKAEAMKLFDAESLAFEQFQMQLDLDRELGMEQLAKNVDIAHAQAGVFGEALKAADMTIVGGQEAFFKSFTNALTVGKMVEGFLDNSPTAQSVVDRAMNHFTGGPKAAPSKKAAQDPNASHIDPNLVTDLTPGE